MPAYTANDPERWEELLARAERERSLAAEGRWEELAAAGAERARVAMTLPPPSPEARPLLERLAQVQDELTAALVRGYSPASGGAGGWIDESR